MKQLINDNGDAVIPIFLVFAGTFALVLIPTGYFFGWLANRSGGEAREHDAKPVLYDHPGPRARSATRILTVVFGLALLALLYWIYRKFDEKGQWAARLWEPFLEADTWTGLHPAGPVGTLSAAATAWCSR